MLKSSTFFCADLNTSNRIPRISSGMPPAEAHCTSCTLSLAVSGAFDVASAVDIPGYPVPEFGGFKIIIDALPIADNITIFHQAMCTNEFSEN